MNSGTENDLLLLRRYAASRDAEAFEGLTRRHAPMVFAVALRVTGNRHDAEDVAQTCFMEMARNATAIRTSLAGWLHTLATHRARNLQRDQWLRRTREVEAGALETASDASDWSALEPLVDEALASLPKELQEPLVRHFLQGRNQSQIAEELGISQATVSRRLREGVTRLRQVLQGLGITCTVTVLSSLLSKASAVEISADLRASLGKLALAGIGPTSAQALRATFPWVSLFGGVAALVGFLGISFVIWKASDNSQVVRIEGVPPLKWGASQDGNTTYLGAIAAAARAGGLKTNYTRIMGDTGLALSVRWCRRESPEGPSWLSLGVFGDGAEEKHRMEQALGARTRTLSSFGLVPVATASLTRPIAEALATGF
ncbi:MAG TPA: sigma-70 family RNA polymerase sigma factor, partial [Pirellulaceae bacterium]